MFLKRVFHSFGKVKLGAKQDVLRIVVISLQTEPNSKVSKLECITCRPSMLVDKDILRLDIAMCCMSR